MLLDDIKKQYEIDSQIDSVNLDKESLRLPQLHGKYFNFLMDEKMILKKLIIEYDTEYLFKYKYFLGKASEEEIKQRNIDPFPLKILKQDVDIYIKSDQRLNDISVKIELQQIKIEYLESIIKEINNRNWNIRNVIEWRKFTAGVN